MDKPEAELINEFEYQYYGFSPIGFTDSVYNITLAAWEDAVKEISKRYFYEDRILRCILRIPAFVTQTEYLETFRIFHSNDPNVKYTDELYRECAQLETRIVESRFVLAEVGNQLNETNEDIEILKTLINELCRVASFAEEGSVTDPTTSC